MNISLPYAEDTEKLGTEIGMRVLKRPQWGKNIFLFGNLGVGKTSFTQGFARGLGITKSIQSPTFAYVSEYPIPKNKNVLDTFAHMDIYRMGDKQSAHSLEIFDEIENTNIVTVMEWSEYFPKEYLPASRIEIHLSYSEDGNSRTADILFFSPSLPDDATLRTLLDSKELPLDIRKKTAEITKKGLFLAEKLIQKGRVLDTRMVKAGCLLYNPQENSPANTIQFLRKNNLHSLAESVSYLLSYNTGQPLILEEQCILAGILFEKDGKNISKTAHSILEPLLFQAGVSEEEMQKIGL